jgi:SAM-dependent methyltransferase
MTGIRHPTDHGESSHSGEIRTYFERTARQFDHLYDDEAQGAVMRRLNRWLRSDIAERFLFAMQFAERIRAQSVLDVGCGSGRYLQALAEIGVRRAVGIDLSQPMLDLARDRVAGFGNCDVDLVHTDFASWKTEQRFDLVIAMGYFDYQSDPVDHLQKMAGLARHAVIASFPRRHPIRMPIRKLRYILKRCPVHFYRVKQIEEIGRAAGCVRSEVIATPRSHSSFIGSFLTASADQAMPVT